ncbi:MAG: GIY-YIG nuclease family protein [Elusimicrobia bacterium]|nr:GIY-YIG nuclease family protein [Elusimicrobiota bacterium]
MWYIYILKSISSRKIYVGCTDNIKRRLAEHNRSKVKSTKAFVPYKLIYSQEFSNKTLALKRELFLKTGIRKIFYKYFILICGEVAERLPAIATLAGPTTP